MSRRHSSHSQSKRRQDVHENSSPMKKAKVQPPRFADNYFELNVHFGKHSDEGVVKEESDALVRHCNALLNSGGGILCLRRVDTAANADYFLSTLHERLESLLDGKEDTYDAVFCKQAGDEAGIVHLFVRGASCLSTVNYQMTVPLEFTTKVKRVQPGFEFVMDKVKTIHGFGSINVVQPYGGVEFEADALTDIMAGPEVHFRSYDEFTSESDDKWNIPKLVFHMQQELHHYVAAFGNSSGGRILIGVEEDEETGKGKVKGFIVDRKQRHLLERGIEQMYSRIFWQPRMKKIQHPSGTSERVVISSFHPVRGQQFYVRWHNVKNTEKENTVVLEITVPAVPGGVFKEAPLAYRVIDGDKGSQIISYGFPEWLQTVRAAAEDVRPESILLERFRKVGPHSLKPSSFSSEIGQGENGSLKSEDVEAESDLLKRFKKIGVSPVKTKKFIYELGDSLQKIKDEVFEVGAGLKITPEAIYDLLPGDAKKLIDHVKNMYKGQEGVMILMSNLASHLNPYHTEPAEVTASRLCDLLVLADAAPPRFLSIVKTQSADHESYAFGVAKLLKRSLSDIAWLGQPYCISYGVLPCTGAATGLQNIEIQKYPNTYRDMSSEKMSALLHALIITLTKVTLPVTNKLGTTIQHILTPEQFTFLWDHFQSSPALLIKGTAGVGKTVVAEETIRRIRGKTGCSEHEILFVCENVPLRRKFKELKLCKAETRLWIKRNMDRGDASIFESVKHIVCDEAHSFSKDGFEWFNTFKELIAKTGGYFWCFYDPQQTGDDTGLPEAPADGDEVVDKDQVPTQEMRTIIRNSLHIAKEAGKYAKDSTEYNKQVEEIVHKFEGVNPAFFSGTKYGLENTIVQQLCWCFEKGYTPGDIALLFRTQELIPFVARYPDCWSDSAQNLLFVEKTMPYASRYASDVNRLNFPSYARIFDDRTYPMDPFLLDIGMDRIPFKNACYPTGNWLVVDTVDRYSGMDRPVIVVVSPRIKSAHDEYQRFMFAAITKAIAKLIVIK